MAISTIVLLTLLVGAAFYTDVRFSVIPNGLNLAGAAAGLINAVALQGASGAASSLIGLAGGFLAVLVLHLFKAVEAGDVKLFGALGAITGIEFALYSIMHAVVLAGLYGLVILLARKLLLTKMLETARIFVVGAAMRDVRFFKQLAHPGNIRMPFMYAVVPGVIATYFYY